MWLVLLGADILLLVLLGEAKKRDAYAIAKQIEYDLLSLYYLELFHLKSRNSFIVYDRCSVLATLPGTQLAFVVLIFFGVASLPDWGGVLPVLQAAPPSGNTQYQPGPFSNSLATAE